MRKIIQLFIIPVLMLTGCTDPEKEFTSGLKETANEINAKCPVMIDSETRLDGIQVKGGKTLTYNYTLVNLEAERVDTAEFNRQLWPGLLANTKISGSMEKLRIAGTVFEYHYKDKAGKSIYTFTILPSHYNETESQTK